MTDEDAKRLADLREGLDEDSSIAPRLRRIRSYADWDEMKFLLRLLDEALAGDCTDRLHRITQWCEAYPIEVFPEPDLAAARAALGDGLYSALHASWARHIVNGIADIARAANPRLIYSREPPK